MTKKFILGFTIIMFFFKSSAIANYEKTFFDLNIESISGDIINFRDFKNEEFQFMFFLKKLLIFSLFFENLFFWRSTLRVLRAETRLTVDRTIAIREQWLSRADFGPHKMIN